MISALFASILFAAPQEEPSIARWIDQLDAESIDDREQAQKRLIQIGPPAIPHLRKVLEGDGSREEVRVRARQALEKIEFNLKVQSVYREPHRYALEAKGIPLRQLLASLQEEARFDLGGVDADQAVDVSAKNATLFEILDQVCAGQESLRTVITDAGVVRFEDVPHVKRPTAYVGPFRIRLLDLSVTRTTTFEETTAGLAFSLECDHEPYLKPAPDAPMEITKVIDDHGRTLEITEPGADELRILRQRGVIVRGVGILSDDPKNRFQAEGLTPDARSLSSIQGTVRYAFPLEARTIVFEGGLKEGDTITTDQFLLRIERVTSSGNIDITATPRTPGSSYEEIVSRFSADSLIAVDEEGTEHLPTNVRPDSQNIRIVIRGAKIEEPQGGAVRWRAYFRQLRGKTVRELRFKFVDQVFIREVPFELKNLPLP